MNELRLLIVEDNKDFRTSYAKQVKIFNMEQSEVIIEAFYAETEDRAKTFLKEGKIDAAVIDLKLGNTDIEYKGNELVDIIKKNLRFPAFIVTANPEKIEEEKNNENDLFKLKVKGTDEGNFTAILHELKSIHLTGITKILGKSGQIETYLNEIFWKHLSNSVNNWISDETRTPDQKEKSLLRYTLLHVQEYLELNDDRNFDDYHPAEVYITPPVKPMVFTGDILEENTTKDNFIVLTPSCDLAQRKAKDILIGRIERNNQGIIFEKKGVISKKKGTKESKEEAKTIIYKLLHNSYSNKYHFLPKYNSIEGGLINFQKVHSVRTKEIADRFDRIAALNSQFSKDVVARFSYYYSRQGAPDFDTDELYKSLF